jgi:hypothetical protein
MPESQRYNDWFVSRTNYGGFGSIAGAKATNQNTAWETHHEGKRSSTEGS